MKPPFANMATRLHYEKNFYRYFYRAGTFEILSQLQSYLGTRVGHVVAHLIAQLYTATHTEVVEVVRDNLSLLQKQPIPRKSAARVFKNFAEVLSDCFAVYHRSPNEAAQMCLDRQGNHILQEAYRRGKGAILATAHFGFFELGSALLAELGIPFTILTLPESTNAMTEWRTKFRTHWNAESIVIGSDPFSSLEAVRALQQGRFVAMLVDRPADQRSLIVDLPGGRTPFSLAAAVLANLAKCPIIPVAIWKTNPLYRMHTHEPIWVNNQGSTSRLLALEEATHKVAQSLLQNIIQAPEQWYQFIPIRA